MQKNTGTTDRWVRVIAGVILLTMVFSGPRTAWGWLGLIPLLTGLTGFCPLYALFGWSTARRAPHGGA